MKITHNLTIDLQRKGNLQKIDVVQGDTYTRLVNISLYNNGVLWEVPTDGGILVRYHKPDGTSGIYEKLPDGSPAGVVEENNVLITLAPQMLTAPGKVPAQVSIVVDDQVLSTFSFIVDVEEDSSKGAIGSENYHNWKSAFIPQTTDAHVGQYLEITKVDSRGRIEEVKSVVNPAISAELAAGEAKRIAQNAEFNAGEALSTADVAKNLAIRNADDIATLSSSKLPQVTGAKVGQYIKITEVDELGRVVAFEAVNAPTSGSISGNLEMHGDSINNVGSLSFIGPSNTSVDGFWIQSGAAVSNEDGSKMAVAEFYSSDTDDNVVIRNVAPGVEDRDAVNLAQLNSIIDTKLGVGADPKGTAASAVSQHNTAEDSHNDIRLELKAINDRLTAFFDSDDQTLDELSEIVAYITSNKSLIDSITTSKVNVADIIHNLTTNVANKPLSAAQGVVLKELIDAVSSSLSNYQPKGDYALRSELPTVPTKVSQLENDTGYLTEHQDISGKLDADKLPEAINTALAQAKASGEFNGPKGDTGATGAAGKDGADGKTPVRGTDYWTDADQEAIVQQVITALGTPVFGRVDADNNIILTGELADGTYTIKYEDAEGNQTEIGTLEQGASYKNLADPSSSDWLTNKRLNSSGVITDTTPSLTTNYIPVQLGDFVRIRFVNIFHQGSGTSSATTHFYDANKNRIASITPVNANVDHIIMDADGLGCSFDMTKASEKFTMVSGHSASEIQFARFVGKLYDGYTKEDVIITVNQEITD